MTDLASINSTSTSGKTKVKVSCWIYL